MGKCAQFTIVSDHGASRPAVLHQQERKYDTDTGGEHSGRCCKIFDGWDIPYAIPEGDYLVLTDYGRFRGSRAANRISLEINGERFAGTIIDDEHFSFHLASLRRAKKYEGKVFDGNDLIGGIEFTARGKAAQMNSDFDELF